MMRIITGRARGTHLVTLAGEATRPTSERAKEAIFSALQFDLAGRVVLDLFAGSGQMGLEAVSRGAKSAVLADASEDAVRIIRANVAKTRLEAECRVVRSDYAELLKRGGASLPEQYDLVILDPPYAMGAIPYALSLLVSCHRLAPGALIVCESATEDVFGQDDALAACFQIRKKARYGVAHVTVLEWVGEA